MWRAVCLFLLIVAVAASAPAQEKPDYSGRWVLVAASAPGPAAASSLVVRQVMKRTNVRGYPLPMPFLELAVERTLGDRVTRDAYLIGADRASGGISGGMVGGGGSRTRFSTRWEWEENRFVITTATSSSSAGDAEASSEHREVWELDSSGQLIIAVTDRDGSESKSNKFTYRRN
jgi:hypothetical protein